VANMYFIPAGILVGANVTWGQFFYWNLIPVTLGNIIGGMVFIGFVYYSAFKKEMPVETCAPPPANAATPGK
jgi:formate transporter